MYVLAFSAPTTVYIMEYLYIKCISLYEVDLKKYAIL